MLSETKNLIKLLSDECGFDEGDEAVRLALRELDDVEEKIATLEQKVKFLLT